LGILRRCVIIIIRTRTSPGDTAAADRDQFVIIASARALASKRRERHRTRDRTESRNAAAISDVAETGNDVAYNNNHVIIALSSPTQCGDNVNLQ